MRPDLGYAGASARKLFQSDRSKASEPKRLLTQLPDLLQTTTQIAIFKAGDKRKTLHQHLFLPKYYSGSPTVSLYTPWTAKAFYKRFYGEWLVICGGVVIFAYGAHLSFVRCALLISMKSSLYIML